MTQCCEKCLKEHQRIPVAFSYCNCHSDKVFCGYCHQKDCSFCFPADKELNSLSSTVWTLIRQAKATERENLIKVVEGLRHEIGQEEIFADDLQEYYKESYNKALQDILTHLKEIKE